MKFCTAVNCMDGRVQLPVIQYLKNKFKADYVDMITEAGPNKILSEQSDPGLIGSIYNRLTISVEKHDSIKIAVVGHHECAGNPKGKDDQRRDTEKAVELIRNKFVNVEVIGLWVDENLNVEKM